jgi:hypothetical protein
MAGQLLFSEIDPSAALVAGKAAIIRLLIDFNTS